MTRSIDDIPIDLVLVIGIIVLADVMALIPVFPDSPVRIVFGSVAVLFLPGYALAAVLFPEKWVGMFIFPMTDQNHRDEQQGSSSLPAQRIDGIERFVLSLGLSICVVILTGLFLSVTPWGIRPFLFSISISFFTILAALFAAVRRRRLPEATRFDVPHQKWIQKVRGFFRSKTRIDSVLNVLLAAVIILAAVSVTYAYSDQSGTSFTAFYLLTQDDSGNLVADGYPTEFSRGEEKQLIIGISNREHAAVNYTVVIELQRVSVSNNSTEVLETEELGRVHRRIKENTTWRLNHTVTPTMTGSDLRLVYLLYRGVPPQNTSINSAYRETHLWINVSQAANRSVEKSAAHSLTLVHCSPAHNLEGVVSSVEYPETSYTTGTCLPSEIAG